MKPGALGSGAGFLQPGRAGPAPAAHPHAIPPPPVTGPGCSPRRQELRLSSPPAPTHAGARPARASPHPASPGEAGRRVLISDLRGRWRGSRREPRSRQSSGRGYRAFTRRERLQNGLAAPTGLTPTPSFPRHFGPPPPPSRAFVPPPGARLFPQGGRPRVRGGGSPSGISNRRLQPPARPARGAEGRAPGGALRSLREGCARPRGAGPGTRIARTRGLGPGRARATGGGVVPGGAAWEGSRRTTRWLGLDCCTFFFVRCIFRNKKKSPTLHTASSASLTTRSSPQRLGGDRRLSACTHNTGWVGRALAQRPAPGL